MEQGIVRCPIKGQIALARCLVYQQSNCSFCRGCTMPTEVKRHSDEVEKERRLRPNNIFQRMQAGRKRWQRLTIRQKYIELKRLTDGCPHFDVVWKGEGPEPKIEEYELVEAV